MQKRPDATPRTPAEQVVRNRNTDTSQRRPRTGRGRGGTTQRRQVQPQDPIVAEGVSPYLGYFTEMQTPATQPAATQPGGIPTDDLPTNSPNRGVVVAPQSVHRFPKPQTERTGLFASGYASGSSDSDTTDRAGQPLSPPKRVAWINVHTILLAIIAFPALLGVALCILHFAVRTEPMGLTHNEIANRIPRFTLPTLTALENEVLAAASLISVVSGTVKNSSQYDAAAYRRQSAQIQKEFLLATQETDTHMSNLLIDYGKHASVYDSQGVIFNKEGLSTSVLDKSRRGVTSGANPWSVLRQYKSVLRTLLTYVARVQLHAVSIDRSSLEALSGIFVTGQWAASRTMRSFLALKRDTASDGRLFRDLQDTNEFRVPWLVAAEVGVFEGYLRYPTATSSEAPASYSSSDNLQEAVLPATVRPSGDVLRQLYQQSLWVRPIDEWHSTVTFTAEDAAAAAKDLSNTLAPLRDAMSISIENSPQQRLIIQLAVISLLLLVCFVTVVAGVANAFLYLKAAPEHASLNATVAQLHGSMSRIVSFVTSLKQLEISTLQLYIRRSLQRGAPLEEASLYKAVGPMRDFETYLPVTVRHPPHQLPYEALGSKAGLFLRPALVHGQGYVALRLGLAEFHSVFSANGPKQKLIHSVLSRMLATLQELGDLACGASEGNTANSPFISVYGDHAVLWFNVSRPIASPCLRAILVAKLLNYEMSRWQGFDKNMLPMSLCAGDAVLGHVGNQLPNSTVNPTPLVSFAALGPLPEDLTLVNHVVRLHQSQFIVNNAAVQGYFRERAELNADTNLLGMQTFHHVLAQNRLSVFGHLRDSSFILSSQEATEYSQSGIDRILHNVRIWATKMANGNDPEPWIEFLPGDNRDVISALAPALLDLLLVTPKARRDNDSAVSGNLKRDTNNQEGEVNSLRYVSSITPQEFDALLRGLTLHFTPVELLEVPLYNSADSGTGEYLPQPDQVLQSGQRFIDFSGVKAIQGPDQTNSIVFPCFVQTTLSEKEEALNAARVLQRYFGDAVMAALADGFVPASGMSQGSVEDSSDAEEGGPGASGDMPLSAEGPKDAGRIAMSLPPPLELERALRRANEGALIEADAQWEVLFKRYVQLSQRMQRSEAVTLMNQLQEYGLQRNHLLGTTTKADTRMGATRLHPSKTSPGQGIHQQHINTNVPTVDRLISLLSTGLELGAIPTSATYLKKSRLLETL